jgi:hypothetical protein
MMLFTSYLAGASVTLNAIVPVESAGAGCGVSAGDGSVGGETAGGCGAELESGVPGTTQPAASKAKTDIAVTNINFIFISSSFCPEGRILSL